MLAFRDRAFATYFSHPQYLDLVRRKFGQDVVTHLQDMNKIRLRRKILGDAPAAAPAPVTPGDAANPLATNKTTLEVPA